MPAYHRPCANPWRHIRTYNWREPSNNKTQTKSNDTMRKRENYLNNGNQSQHVMSLYATSVYFLKAIAWKEILSIILTAILNKEIQGFSENRSICFLYLHDNHGDRRSCDHSCHRTRPIHATNDQCVHNCLNVRIQPIHRMPLQSHTMRSNNLPWIEHKRKKEIQGRDRENEML